MEDHIALDALTALDLVSKALTIEELNLTVEFTLSMFAARNGLSQQTAHRLLDGAVEAGAMEYNGVKYKVTRRRARFDGSRVWAYTLHKYEQEPQEGLGTA